MVATYAYDALGRRIEKTVGTTVTRYVYDGPDIVLEYDASSGSDVLAARFSHGPLTDQPLAMERGGQSYYYHANYQGSVIRVTDALGATVNEYDYDSYGNALVAVEGVDNPYRYTGREWDAETGFLYYRARTYDPVTGRFLQQEPIGFATGDLNLYRYVENDPTNFIDPTGQAKFIGTAIKLIGTATKKLGRITMEQAVRRRRQGENVLAESRQRARQVEIQAFGKENLRKDSPHVLKDGSLGRPHYQTEGKRGHTFWSIGVGIGGALICAGEFLEEAGAAAEEVLTDVSLNPFDARGAQ